MSFVDITLKKTDTRTYYDLDIVSGDLQTTEGFESALNMSILCERRASASEVPSPVNRRGWLGNEALDVADFEIGSKLWLLSQARANNVTRGNAVTYTKDATQWFIDDNDLDKINVSAQFGETFGVNGVPLELGIDLIRSQDIVLSKNYKLWDNTIEESI